MSQAPRRVLFVCSANFDRSPTAEALCKGVAGLEAKSAGASSWARTPVSREMIQWADMVFVMEQKHEAWLLALAPEAKGKIVVLDVPDVYRFNQPELRQLLREKLVPYLPQLNH